MEGCRSLLNLDRIPRRMRCVLAVLLLVLGSATAQVRTVTLLHVNDLHARLLPDQEGRGGFAQLATAIRQERSHCTGCLLLHAGDLVQGTPVSTIYRGLPVIEISNLFHFDVSTLGNHEFDYGIEQTRRFLAAARYPEVTANLVDSRGRLLAAHPYVVLQADGVRVGVLGLILEDLPAKLHRNALGDYRVLPVVTTVRKYLPELQKEADIIVVLGHLEDHEADAILHKVPEVSAIVVGHDHRGLQSEVRRGRRVLVECEAYGRELGRLELQVDVAKKQVVSSSWRRIPVTSATYAADPEMAEQVKAWEAKVSPIVEVRIGESRHWFDREQVKTLIERALVEETGADFAYTNLGGVRDTLPQGTILARHIWNIMPFDNRVAMVTYQGSELPGFLARGTHIDPARSYRVATTDFVVNNSAESAKLGSRGKPTRIMPSLLRDLLIAWVKKRGTVE